MQLFGQRQIFVDMKYTHAETIYWLIKNTINSYLLEIVIEWRQL
jgi:hypothetical protein